VYGTLTDGLGRCFLRLGQVSRRPSELSTAWPRLPGDVRLALSLVERSMAVKLELERRAREQRDRALAVIAEFGDQKPERMLVPEDDPANNELVMRLADEILFLRDQIRRISKVMGLVQAGKPFALLPHGPYGQPDELLP
jgi:hypothetical protein